MGQKVHPGGMRVGVIHDWKSNWFAGTKEFAGALLEALEARASHADAKVGFAVFDFGYLVETYKQAKFMFSAPIPAIDSIDGYQLVLKAHALQRDEAMTRAATQLAASSGGRVVDDNGNALDERSLAYSALLAELGEAGRDRDERPGTRSERVVNGLLEAVRGHAEDDELRSLRQLGQRAVDRQAV